MIKKNIERILKEIKPYSAELICVSKTRSDEEILEAYQAGIRDFGENHVQELVEKRSRLPKDIRWHMIGHIQTNKVKSLLEDDIYMIHSIDSVKIANEINKKADKKIDVLLEINIAKEESKYGFPPNISFLREVYKQIERLENIHVLGLMCVAPITEHPEDNLIYFKKMNELKEKLNLQILSMGMTNDYLAACMEHSNYIRIGTGIFGERTK